MRRLGRARELGVHRFIERRPGLLRRGEACLALVDHDLLEEVGEPAPGAVREVRLVDDLRLAGADRLLGEPARLVGVEPAVVVGRDADDRAAFRLEPCEVRRLVLVALAPDEVAVRVVDVRPLELPALHAQVERGQVRAREVPREVGGREEQRAVIREPHHWSISGGAAWAYNMVRLEP